MEDTIVHEMIHAFDHCRFDVNWLDLRHHACSEVSSRQKTVKMLSGLTATLLASLNRSALPICQEIASGLGKCAEDSMHSPSSIR
jgi:hypothetical protein